MPIKRRILCVDDYADICEFIRSILTEYEVVLAHSKTEGVRKVKSRQFDDSTPILITTGSHPINERDVSNVGAQGLVSKDNLSQDLLRQVSHVLNPDPDS